MKLEFRLLVVDNAPDNIIEGAVGILSDHLELKGFSLNKRFVNDFSEAEFRGLARLEGKDYDLVMVDYRLELDDMDGADVARQLRLGLRYTDMVFYSSAPPAELRDKLAKASVSGVFVETRDNLSDALTGLADTVIGKAVDLNHMRGIAMAEVAEMDVLMEETLGRAFQPTGEHFVAAAGRTTDKLRESMQGNLTQLNQCLEEGSLADVVSDSRLFSSAHKYRAVRRVANSLSEKPIEELNVLKSYQADIIDNRNMLAHVKEDSTEDGETILRSIKGNVIIDDDWMTDFRMKLKEYRTALTTICEAIISQIDAKEAPHESK